MTDLEHRLADLAEDRVDALPAAAVMARGVQLRRARASLRALLAVTVLLVASAIVGLATLFLTRAVIDDALPTRDIRLLLLLVGAMVLVNVATAAFVFPATSDWKVYAEAKGTLVLTKGVRQFKVGFVTATGSKAYLNLDRLTLVKTK